MPAESGGITVLYVDADAEVADRTVRLLEEASETMTVTAVRTASEALETLETVAVDCIVSAYALQEIDGVQFLQAVRAEYPGLPFILYATAGSEEIASAAISAGVSDYLDKAPDPHDRCELATRIQTAVDRQQARSAELTDSERTKQILEASPDGIVVSVDRELVYSNRAASELLGGTAESIVGVDPVALTESDPTLWDAETVQAAGEMLTRHRESFSTLDGEQATIELTTNEVTWKGEAGVVAVLRDVSDPLEYEQQAKRARSQLEGIIDIVSAAIFVKDSDGRYLLMNNRCRELLGIDESTNLVGMADEELFGPDMASQILADDRRVFENAETVEIEETVPTKEGERTLLTRKTPLFDDDGEPYALCAVSTDITRQTEREHALTERIKELSAIHRVVQQFESNQKPTLELLEEFVEVLPGSFQYPERTETCIEYGELTATTGKFDEQLPSIAAVAETANGPDVRVEAICRTDRDEPFLPEEQSLLETLSTIVASYLERRTYIQELERYETTLRALGDPVYALDSDGRFSFVNDALVSRTGYERGDLLGEDSSLVLTDEGAERGGSVIQELFSDADRQTAKWEMEVVTADGEQIPVENHVALLPFGNDGFRGTAGVVRDITERNERERKLRRRKDLLVRTERMADVGGWELDTETNQLYWSEGTHLIHEVSAEYEPTPADATEFYHPGDRDRIRELVEQCREFGDPFDGEARLITAEGRERRVQIRGEAVTENGTRKLRGTIQDITEIREHEQQLTVLNRVLRHNLRNNLNVVTANAELLRGQLEAMQPMIESESTALDGLTARELAAADVLTEAFEHLDQLEMKAWELLAIADKSRELAGIIGKIEQTETVDFESLLSQLVDEYQQLYASATIRLDTTDIEATVNPESVHLAIEELLENALKHGGEDPKVEITVQMPTENRIEIIIADDGPGIPEMERQALEQGEETALKHSSGFGLWTVNWLLGRLGGAVSIEDSEPGTVARIELPVE